MENWLKTKHCFSQTYIFTANKFKRNSSHGLFISHVHIPLQSSVNLVLFSHSVLLHIFSSQAEIFPRFLKYILEMLTVLFDDVTLKFLVKDQRYFRVMWPALGWRTSVTQTNAVMWGCSSRPTALLFLSEHSLPDHSLIIRTKQKKS